MVRNLATATQDEVAAVLGISAMQVSRLQKTEGAPTGINVPEFVGWYVERQLRRATTQAGGDPDMVGGDSPALERYRAAKADLAELDRDERRMKLIPRDQAEESARMRAQVMRRAGEKLQRRFGVEAQEILDDAIDEATRIIEKTFGAKS